MGEDIKVFFFFNTLEFILILSYHPYPLLMKWIVLYEIKFIRGDFGMNYIIYLILLEFIQ